MLTEKNRPNPDDLLKAVEREADDKRKGKLRIFLGMCPGVGKTYAMLKAAQEMQAGDKNVVVGYIETHGRKDTEALLQGLKILPPMEISYKGGVFKEFDLEGALKLDPIPDVLLIDELAHQNVPGARHQKRYQDVLELLNLGFNIYTTVNIQHIESRKDQVAQITGVVVKENVPDLVFEEASEVEVVDLSPRELLKRLSEGKVYLGDERAKRAQQNFFQEEKLTALRELALRFTAEKVDQDLNQHMALKGIEGPWNTNERLLVAVSSSPSSARLVRATRRMAYSLSSPWIALYVDTGVTLGKEDKNTLERNLSLAKELGAEVITVADLNITNAIQKITDEKNVTRIVMGRPEKNFFRDFFRGGTLLEQLVKKVSLDIHVLHGDRSQANKRRWLPRFSTRFSAYLWTSLAILAVTAVFYSMLVFVNHRFLGYGFLLALIAIAVFARRGLIIYSAISFATIWYVLFIPPSFAIFDRRLEDLMLVVSFLVVGTMAGWLTARIRRQEIFLMRRESRSKILYEFTQEIGEVQKTEDVVEILTKSVRNFVDSEVQVLLRKPDGNLAIEAAELETTTKGLVFWVFEHQKIAGKYTTTLSGLDSFALPIASEESKEGVLLIKARKPDYFLTAEDESFLHTLTLQAGSLLYKLNLEQIASTSQHFMERAQLHEAVMHILNFEVKGSLEHSKSLLESLLAGGMAKEFLYSKGKDLGKTIKRLELVVDNLIYISKLEADQLRLNSEQIDCQKFFDEVIDAIVPPEDKENVVIDLQFKGSILVDHDLLKQAFMNLLNFAFSLSPADGKIGIYVSLKQDGQFLCSIIDEGIELSLDEAESLFNFEEETASEEYLALSIVKNVLDLHGGQIRVYNIHNQKGNCFEVTLPSRLIH